MLSVVPFVLIAAKAAADRVQTSSAAINHRTGAGKLPRHEKKNHETTQKLTRLSVRRHPCKNSRLLWYVCGNAPAQKSTEMKEKLRLVEMTSKIIEINEIIC